MSAEFRLVRDLACTPESAWRLLTDPDQMNRWSTAAVSPAATGIGDRPDSMGALRVVTLPGGRSRLREVVESAEFPRRFVYRVYDGGPLLLDHLGEQLIVPTPAGCRVSWTVRLTLACGLSGVVARSVAKQVGESLDALQRIAARHPELPGTAGPCLEQPRPEPLRPEQSVPAPPTDDPARLSRSELSLLRGPALAALTAQTRIADRLAASNDPKQWFARVYQYVTTELIALADQPAALRNPDWVLRLIPEFHEHFTANLAAYESGGECTRAWRRAWSSCEREDHDHPERPVMRGLLAGVSAHIDDDLPRALVEVHRTHYPERDLREFLPDYLRLAPVFTAASDRLLADLPRSHQPWWTPLATRIHPKVRDELLGRKGFHVGRRRLKAFAAARAASRAGADI